MSRSNFGTTDEKEHAIIHEILMKIAGGALKSSVEEKMSEEAEKKEKEHSEELKRLRDQIVDMLRDCGDRSSIHSFPSFASRKVPVVVKLIWIVCIAFSWGFLIYLVRNMIGVYNSYNVVSSISLNYEASFSEVC